MPDITLDGRVLHAAPGTTLASVLMNVGDGTARTSVSGQRRAPLCGMGICMECRVMVDGVRRLACQTVCRDGMQVETRP